MTNIKRREEKLLSTSDGAFFPFISQLWICSLNAGEFTTVNANASCAIDGKTLANIHQERPT